MPYFRFNASCATTSTTTTNTTILQITITVYARQISPTTNLDLHYSTDGGSTWNFNLSSISTTCAIVATFVVANGSSLNVRIGSDISLTTVYSSNLVLGTSCPAYNSGTAQCSWALNTLANRTYALTADYQNTNAC